MNSILTAQLRERAHTIRNDLAIISGYASLLANAANLDEHQQLMAQKMANRAVELAGHLQALLDDIEQASRGQ